MTMGLAILLALCLGHPASPDDKAEINASAYPALLKAHCAKCHGEAKPKGAFRVMGGLSAESPEAKAVHLQRILDAVESGDMPPEGEPGFTDRQRDGLVGWLKESIRSSSRAIEKNPPRMHRLTRVQYNNAVRDLFRLNRDIFALPEKLMTRQDRHVPSATGKMPESVRVASLALKPQPGLAGVIPFPKDLRAEHGYDNQADKLTLSPLLLDAFLKLGVSILESPDFNPQTVGIWKDFFQEPGAKEDQAARITNRLRPFLRIAFRGPVEDEVVRRYSAFAESKIRQGTPFTEAMKKVASAVLCSPLFLYRSSSADGSGRQFELASRLSFFLWSSIPDTDLLDMAERGEFDEPAAVRRAINRMMADPKIERFLDSFPTQWLQLENVLGATPDPVKSPYFNLGEGYPASLAMVLEPLLLFDAAFIEDRPIAELVSPSFSYRNPFLRDWYGQNLAPVIPTPAEVTETNRLLDARRKEIQSLINQSQAAIDSIVEPAKARWVADGQSKKPADLKPYASWDFDAGLKDSVHGLEFKPVGDVRQVSGEVVLGPGYLQSGPLPVELKAKTMEVWCEVADINQRGGGLMTIEGPGGLFDSIVLGERKPGHWISGSNQFARTEDFAESEPESTPSRKLHLVMVYGEDGTTRLYRNGQPYGKPFRKGSTSFPKDKSIVLLGLRHLPAGGNRHLSVRIDKARLYDRALSPEEVATVSGEGGFSLPEEALATLVSKADRARLGELRENLGRDKRELESLPTKIDYQQFRKGTIQAFQNQLKEKLRSPEFQRVALSSPRDGGVITNAAVLSMTSGPTRTQPIARGSWILGVIFNDPPAPPPNNVPPLQETNDANLTIREQFAAHREHASCAGCHAKIDPLGFALENFDITGRWREKYENGRPIDASGTLWRKHAFTGVTDFKAAIVGEKDRFAKAFSRHLLRYALARELLPPDLLTVDEIIASTRGGNYRLQTLIREVAFHAAGGASGTVDEKPKK